VCLTSALEEGSEKLRKKLLGRDRPLGEQQKGSKRNEEGERVINDVKAARTLRFYSY
jgi:hypothetical protein